MIVFTSIWVCNRRKAGRLWLNIVFILMIDEKVITSSLTPLDLQILDEYPEELYEWEDFMRFFPIMQGNYTMHPMFWKLYMYQEEKNKEHN